MGKGVAVWDGGVWPMLGREIEKEKFYNVLKFVSLSIDHHMLSIRY